MRWCKFTFSNGLDFLYREKLKNIVRLKFTPVFIDFCSHRNSLIKFIQNNPVFILKCSLLIFLCFVFTRVESLNPGLKVERSGIYFLCDYYRSDSLCNKILLIWSKKAFATFCVMENSSKTTNCDVKNNFMYLGLK